MVACSTLAGIGSDEGAGLDSANHGRKVFLEINKVLFAE
jgi:hypothetical protein